MKAQIIWIAAGTVGIMALALTSMQEVAGPADSEDGTDVLASFEVNVPDRGDDDLRVVQWNVENLFDAEDDPDNEGDDEFSPGSWRSWTEARYLQKLTHLADVITAVDPDILCLEELENRQVLEDLNRALGDVGRGGFEYIQHREGQDHRGIDIAIMSRIEPRAVRWITPVERQRDIMIADFDLAGHAFTILVNHWKSQWGDKEVGAKLRSLQAVAARHAVDEILRRRTNAAILVVGDFNVDHETELIQKRLRSITDREAVLTSEDGLLFNMHGTIPAEEQGTFYYRRGERWNSFDGMSVSRALLDRESVTYGGSGWKVKPGSYAVVRSPRMLDEEGFPLAFRKVFQRDLGRRVYVTGFSDHLPVTVTLVLKSDD